MNSVKKDTLDGLDYASPEEKKERLLTLTPAAGYYNSSSNKSYDGTIGNYWSSTQNDSNNAYNVNFNNNNFNASNNNNKTNYNAVRLVQHPSPDSLLTELFLSYYSARSNKRNTYTQSRFERNLVLNIVTLWDEIRTRRYRVGRSICFIIDRPVKREVFAASFRDRVIHHLLYRYLMPVFDPIFIYDSYSCREGKGTLFGIKRLEHHLRSCSQNYTKTCYILKLDLQGYFMSIDRQRLYDIVISTLRAKGKHKDDVYPTIDFLLRQVIFNDPTKGCYMKGSWDDWKDLPQTKSLFYTREGCGLPIGNLTSQLFSNVYLNLLDQYVKRTLKIKHYGRYVDDFYLIHESKDYLLDCIRPIRDFLDKELCLKLHPKKVYLQSCWKGVQFLGAVIKPRKRFPAPRGIKRMRVHLAETFSDVQDPYYLRAVVGSYVGYLGNFNCAPSMLRKVWGPMGHPAGVPGGSYYRANSLNKIVLRKEQPDRVDTLQKG